MRLIHFVLQNLSTLAFDKVCVCGLLQESERLISLMLSMQPRTSPAAGAVPNDVLVATMAQDILASLPAPLAREDASIARDPFAPLPTGVPLRPQDSPCLYGH